MDKATIKKIVSEIFDVRYYNSFRYHKINSKWFFIYIHERPYEWIVRLNFSVDRKGLKPSKGFRIFRELGAKTFEEAASICDEIRKEIDRIQDKIEAFDCFLQKNGNLYALGENRFYEGCSRYYIYDGVRYRFSNHYRSERSVSLHKEKVICFFTDPYSIDSVIFKL